MWLLTPTATGLTTLDQSHCAFAGTIAEIGEGERGETTLALEDVRRTIFQTQLMRDPFKAKLKEGVYVKAGDRFSIRTTRQVSGGGTTVGIGNDLVGTVSASGANQIEPGIYTVQELGARLLSWLQAEKIADKAGDSFVSVQRMLQAESVSRPGDGAVAQSGWMTFDGKNWRMDHGKAHPLNMIARHIAAAQAEAAGEV